MALYIALLSVLIIGCGKTNSSSVNTAQAPGNDFLKGAEIVSVDGRNAYIFRPTVIDYSKPQKWVWYAPSFINGGTPNSIQHEFYFTQLRNMGFAVVGVDVGESYGSPSGREGFLALYEYLKANGFESSGVFLLQSRGGLMGYTFLKEHPEAAKAVAGIYPLVSFEDYIGPSGFAPAWGLSVDQFNLDSLTVSPLVNAASYTFPIYHLHGDADNTVHISYDQSFVSTAPNAQLETVHGQGHEVYSPEFFANANLLSFIGGF